MLGLTSVECRQFSVRNSAFSFPKHKELLTEDFYDDESQDRQNPYRARKGVVGDDFEDYSRPTHRATPTGVLSSYKKQINLQAEDIM